jgi:hypothetical protein
MSTYLGATSSDLEHALELYAWNAQVSAALMLPAHFAEVAVRNVVDEALTDVYGAKWPWDPAFELSVPAPGRGYNPRGDLMSTRREHTTTGKVIADLKFVFWEKMFTARHDVRVWNSRILTLIPNAPAGLTAKELRLRVMTDLEAIRRLRNRLAHHEPIFSRDIGQDLGVMLDLVEMRCAHTVAWVRSMEQVTDLLKTKP